MTETFRHHWPFARSHGVSVSRSPPVRSLLPAYLCDLNPRFPPRRRPPLAKFPATHCSTPVSDSPCTVAPLRDITPSGSGPPGHPFELPCGALPLRFASRTVQTLSKRLAFGNRFSPSLPAKPVFKADHRSRLSRSLWLTVPCASWNLLHYAPVSFRCQKKNARERVFCTTFIWPAINKLRNAACEKRVDKTRRGGNVSCAHPAATASVPTPPEIPA